MYKLYVGSCCFYLTTSPNVYLGHSITRYMIIIMTHLSLNMKKLFWRKKSELTGVVLHCYFLLLFIMFTLHISILNLLCSAGNSLVHNYFCKSSEICSIGTLLLTHKYLVASTMESRKSETFRHNLKNRASFWP